MKIFLGLWIMLLTLATFPQKVMANDDHFLEISVCLSSVFDSPDLFHERTKAVADTIIDEVRTSSSDHAIVLYNSSGNILVEPGKTNCIGSRASAEHPAPDVYSKVADVLNKHMETLQSLLARRHSGKDDKEIEAAKFALSRQLKACALLKDKIKPSLDDLWKRFEGTLGNKDRDLLLPSGRQSAR